MCLIKAIPSNIRVPNFKVLSYPVSFCFTVISYYGSTESDETKYTQS